MEKIQKVIIVGPLIRPQGLDFFSKLINVGSTFIPDYRVDDKWKKIIQFGKKS